MRCYCGDKELTTTALVRYPVSTPRGQYHKVKILQADQVPAGCPALCGNARQSGCLNDLLSNHEALTAYTDAVNASGFQKI